MGAPILLHRTFPCCGGRSRFVADAPAYDRRCRRCGTAWTVRRTTRPPSDFARRLGARFDTLVWERAAATLAVCAASVRGPVRAPGGPNDARP